MIRALRFLALLSAFFVVAVRCFGGLPLLIGCSEPAASAVIALCASSEQSADDGTLALSAEVDDGDDDVEPALTPAALPLEVAPFIDVSAPRAAIRRAAGPLPSHAPTLDRPPRV